MITPEKVFDHLSDAMVICSSEYEILDSNRSENLVYGDGYSLKGKMCYELIRRNESPCEDCPLQETINTGKMIPVENYDERFGEYMEERTHPVFSEENELTGFILTNKNVTKDREIKNKNRQDNKMTAIGYMSSGIAHDFNNLLQIVMGRVSIIKKKGLDKALVDQLEIIERAARNGASTVKKMQDFSRNSNGIKEVPVNLSSLVENVLELTENKWKENSQKKGILIHINVNIEPDLYILGNASELQNGFTNIIFNAVDAMPNGGIIHVNVDGDDEMVSASFKDTGMGMTEDTVERIFDPFFTTKGANGSGLGMSEVYGMVQRHNGEISVDSNEGDGTDITIRFPITHEIQIKQEEIITYEDRQLNILVIDDENDVLEVIEDLLSDLGHNVTGFISGKKAIQQFKESDFDVVITDLGMTEMSGKQVAEKIKLISPDTPVILLSGWAINVKDDAELKLCVDYSITKPFDANKIQDIVSKAANMKISSHND